MQKKNQLGEWLTNSIACGPCFNTACEEWFLYFEMIEEKEVKKKYSIFWHMKITYNSNFSVHKYIFMETQPVHLPLSMAAFAHTGKVE